MRAWNDVIELIDYDPWEKNDPLTNPYFIIRDSEQFGKLRVVLQWGVSVECGGLSVEHGQLPDFTVMK